MNVYLLPRREGYFLYAPGVSPESPEKPAPADSAARKLVAHARRAYAWATRSRRDEELLMKSLGELEHERLTIFYPSSMPRDDVQRTYQDLLADTVDKHRKWMIVNTAALPAAVPLSLIPGPNVLLGYLAWRSVAHYRTKQAAEKATGLPIDFVSEPVLAELEDVVRNQTRFRRRRRIEKLGAQLGLERLDAVYSS